MKKLGRCFSAIIILTLLQYTIDILNKELNLEPNIYVDKIISINSNQFLSFISFHLANIINELNSIDDKLAYKRLALRKNMIQ